MKKAIAACMAVLCIVALCSCAAASQQPNTPAPTQGGSNGQGANNRTAQPEPVNPDQSDPGDQRDPGNQGDPGDQNDQGDQGDAGDTYDPEWWGAYKNDDIGFSIDITEYSGTDFWAEICLLRNGSTMLAGKAVISAEDTRFAELGDVSFYLDADFSSIDLFVAEGSEWAHLGGTYTKIE